MDVAGGLADRVPHRHSIATVALGGTLGEKLAAASAAGFHGVELFEPDLIAAPLAPEEVRRRLADLGLVLELYQPLRDIDALPPDRFRRRLDLVRAKFDLMIRLGARMALLCTNVSPDAIDDDDLAAEQLSAVADEARSRGLTVAYEALAWGTHVSEYDHAWRIVERAGHPALGVCLDSFHILARGTSLAGIAAIPAGKLFMLQLADAPRMRMDELQWSRHYRCFPGQGAFDLETFLARVLAAGYAGPLSLEIFNDIFRQADPFRTAVDGRRSLLWLAERAGESLPGNDARPPVPAPLAGAGLRGFAFVELNAPPETAGGVDRLLAGLGLRRTGVHRSKPVELWEAGEARILVNSGRRAAPAPGQFAVAAVGLDVAAAEPVARRATALRAPLVPRHRNWDEADLVAIEAPDGVEIFVCEEGGGWRGDFDRCPGEHPFGARARLTGIDHVALGQPLTLFHESVLFYRSLLGLVPLDERGTGVAERPDQEPGAGRRGRGGAGQARAQRAGARRRARRGTPAAARCDTVGRHRGDGPRGLRPGAVRAARARQLLRGPRRQARARRRVARDLPPLQHPVRRGLRRAGHAPLLRHLRPGRRAVRDRRPRARLHGLRGGERSRSHGRPGNRVMRIRGE